MSLEYITKLLSTDQALRVLFLALLIIAVYVLINYLGKEVEK